MGAPWTNIDINKGGFGLLASGTSAANSSQTVSAGGFGRPFRVLSVEIAYSGPATQGGVTVTRNAELGAAFDTLLDTLAANSQYSVYIPTEPLVLRPGDTLDVAAPAGGGGVTSHIAVYGMLL